MGGGWLVYIQLLLLHVVLAWSQQGGQLGRKDGQEVEMEDRLNFMWELERTDQNEPQSAAPIKLLPSTVWVTYNRSQHPLSAVWTLIWLRSWRKWRDSRVLAAPSCQEGEPAHPWLWVWAVIVPDPTPTFQINMAASSCPPLPNVVCVCECVCLHCFKIMLHHMAWTVLELSM